MARLTWDETGEKLFEAGVKNVVLYPWDATPSVEEYGDGVSWSGISAVNESPSGADETKIYANDSSYLSIRAKEEFGGTIEAYMYPDEWEECDGSKIVNVTGTGSTILGSMRLGQQTRKTFGLTYITTIGNDTESYDYGEKIHFVYGATASPSSRDHATINDSPDISPFSWEFSTVALANATHLTIAGVVYKPVAHFTISSTDFTNGVSNARFKLIKEMIQGRTASGTGESAITELLPHLPYPDEIYSVIAGNDETSIPARFKPAG